MAEVLAAITVVAEGASLCVKATSVLNKFSRDAKAAQQDLVDILQRVERTKNLLELVRVALVELKNTGISDLSLALDVQGVQATLNDVLQLASVTAAGQAQLGVYKRLLWAVKKSTAASLLRRLEGQERDLLGVLTAINTASSLRTQRGLESLIRRSTEPVEIHDAFSKLTIVDGSPWSPNAFLVGGRKRVIRTWLGHILTDGLPSSYVSLRDGMSEAAYWGSWDDIWVALEQGEALFGESWVNAIRMKPMNMSDQMSFWTPLHQAVFNHASREVVQRLLELGAFRTLRTRWTAYSQLDMSPLELARELSVDHLYDILAPVIRTHIPVATLSNLEMDFHNMIRRDLGTCVEVERLYLPLLEPLTELDREPMWFPVRFTHHVAGYLYQLESRELLVRTMNVCHAGEIRTYRVTENGIYEVEEALIFDGKPGQQSTIAAPL